MVWIEHIVQLLESKSMQYNHEVGFPSRWNFKKMSWLFMSYHPDIKEKAIFGISGLI